MSAVSLVGGGWIAVVALVLVARHAAVRARLVGPASHPTARMQWSAWPKRRRRRADELPDLLDDLARSLRSGLSLRQALVALPSLGSLGGPTERMRHELELGQPIGAATQRWIARIDDPLADLAGAALVLIIDAGGTGAETIDRVAATVRDRRAIRLETQVQASQARASASVIAALPVGFFVLAVAADPAVAGFLFGTPLGGMCLAAGLVLDGVGVWWMRGITEDLRW